MVRAGPFVETSCPYPQIPGTLHIWLHLSVYTCTLSLSLCLSLSLSLSIYIYIEELRLFWRLYTALVYRCFRMEIAPRMVSETCFPLRTRKLLATPLNLRLDMPFAEASGKHLPTKSLRTGPWKQDVLRC